MKYIIKWIQFERAPNTDVYVLAAPLEFYNIVNIIKIHYPNADVDKMRCLCLLKEKEK